MQMLWSPKESWNFKESLLLLSVLIYDVYEEAGSLNEPIFIPSNYLGTITILLVLSWIC